MFYISICPRMLQTAACRLSTRHAMLGISPPARSGGSEHAVTAILQRATTTKLGGRTSPRRAVRSVTLTTLPSIASATTAHQIGDCNKPQTSN
jgi:hypothetical protein